MGKDTKSNTIVEFDHEYYGPRRLLCEGGPDPLFTENETNTRRLYGDVDGARYVKDGINDYVVQGDKGAVNPDQIGSKASAHYRVTALPDRPVTIRLRFTNGSAAGDLYPQACEAVFAAPLEDAG